MVGGTASALGNLRPGASGASASSSTTGGGNATRSYSSASYSTSSSQAAAPDASSTARLPPPLPPAAEVHSPGISTTDSPSPSPSGDDDDDETQHNDDDGGIGHGRDGNASSGFNTALTAANSASAYQRRGAQEASAGGGLSALDAKKPRACEACRGLKVRCDMDPNAPPETPCRRCAKAGRRCVVTQPTRRRQKKTDSRVAELEKKIDALTASLQLTRQPTTGPNGEGSPSNIDGGEVGGRLSLNATGNSGIVRNWPSILDPPPPQQPLLAPPLQPTSASSAPGGGTTNATTTGPSPQSLASHSQYAASPGGRSTFSSGPPPMVMAGQKRKFSEIREATGVVGAGAGGGVAGSRTSLGSRAGSVAGDESPSMRENPYQGYHGHPSNSHHPQHHHQSQYSQPGQKYHAQEAKLPPTQQSPAFNMSPSPATVGNTARFGTEYADIIDRGLLTMDKAVELFQRYTEHMAKHMPAVVFPTGTTAAEIRKSKPVLFLSIMAASTTEMSEIQRCIVKELMQVFAEKVFVTGEKSLELVQALQLSVIWYWPPEHFEELKFYQLVHNAAIMAIDIGLGKKRPGGGNKGGPLSNSGHGLLRGGAGLGRPGLGDRQGGPFGNWRDHQFKKHPPPDSCSIEGRRAWLACYFLTSNTAMALHRPNLVRWTSFMTECVEVLETSPDAAPTDQYLCHLVWTHRMAEEVGLQFSMDDPSTVINIADPRTQYALRGFERELDRYKSTIPRNLLQPSLRLSFEVLSLYMHEIALQTENGNDDFKTPYTAESTKEALIGDATLTPAHIRALTACLLAIDGIFDAFLGMDIASLRCIPVFNFVRVAYATVVMIKLYLFASSPNSELGKVINKEHMKVEQHLNALLDKFRATASENRSRPAGKFMIVLAMIRSWFLKQQVHNPPDNGEGNGQNNGESNRSTGHDQQQQQATASNVSASISGSLGNVQNGAPAAAQIYQPSATFLSASSLGNANNNNSNPGGANPRTSTAPSAAATPSPSATPGGSYSTPGANNNQAQQQQQSQVQPSANVHSSANTPLQLLSEIAANDYAANAASAAANRQQQPQPQPQTGNPPPGPNSIPAWPSFYSVGTNNNNENNGGDQGQQQQQQTQQQPQPPQQVAMDQMMQPPTSGDFMAMYPNLNMGDNFEHALDLTFAGLSEGTDNLDLSDGIQYILADPWFGGMPGGAFQF